MRAWIFEPTHRLWARPRRVGGMDSIYPLPVSGSLPKATALTRFVRKTVGLYGSALKLAINPLMGPRCIYMAVPPLPTFRHVMDRPLYPQRLRTTRPAIPPGVANWLDRLVLDEQPPSISQRIVHELRIVRGLQGHSLGQEGHVPVGYTRTYVLSFASHSQVWHRLVLTSRTHANQRRRVITAMTPSPEQPARLRGTDASSQYLGSLGVMGGEDGSSPSTYAAHCSTGRSDRTGRTSRGRKLYVNTLVSAPGTSILAVLKERRRNDIEPYSPSASTSLQTTDFDYSPYFS